MYFKKVLTDLNNIMTPLISFWHYHHSLGSWARTFRVARFRDNAALWELFIITVYLMKPIVKQLF